MTWFVTVANFLISLGREALCGNIKLAGTVGGGGQGSRLENSIEWWVAIGDSCGDERLASAHGIGKPGVKKWRMNGWMCNLDRFRRRE